MRKGWYHTGDLAKSDANGYLTITGRIKELIIRGGQNIAPAEIEEVAIRHSQVIDCAVVGVPHATLGEVPYLFVVAEKNELDVEFAAGALPRQPVVLQNPRSDPHRFRNSAHGLRARSCASSSWKR